VKGRGVPQDKPSGQNLYARCNSETLLRAPEKSGAFFVLPQRYRNHDNGDAHFLAKRFARWGGMVRNVRVSRRFVPFDRQTVLGICPLCHLPGGPPTEGTTERAFLCPAIDGISRNRLFDSLLPMVAAPPDTPPTLRRDTDRCHIVASRAFRSSRADQFFAVSERKRVGPLISLSGESHWRSATAVRRGMVSFKSSRHRDYKGHHALVVHCQAH
jgi:hypothetical protein